MKRIRRNNKLFSLALMLCMTLSLMPAVVLPAHAANNVRGVVDNDATTLMLGGIDVLASPSDDNLSDNENFTGGSYSYDSETLTLTLTDVLFDSGENHINALNIVGDVNIVLNGANSFNCASWAISIEGDVIIDGRGNGTMSVMYGSCGIYMEWDTQSTLRVKDTTLTLSDIDAENGNGIGIDYEKGDLLIDGAHVIVSAGYVGVTEAAAWCCFIFNGGILETTAYDGIGIDAQVFFYEPELDTLNDPGNYTPIYGTEVGTLIAKGDSIAVNGDLYYARPDILLKYKLSESDEYTVIAAGDLADALGDSDDRTFADSFYYATYLEIVVSCMHNDGGGEFIETLAPTCETPGVLSRATDCALCGGNDLLIPAFGHDWEYSEALARTCTQDGSDLYVCQNDEGHTKLVSRNDREIVIDMTDSYGDGWTGNEIVIIINNENHGSATIANKAKTGTYSFTATYGDEIELQWVQGNWPEECAFWVHYFGEDSALVELNEDDLESKETGATLGTFTVTSRSGENEAALGHSMPGVWTVRTAATCNAEGLEFMVCQSTGCTYEVTQSIAIDASAHDWDEDWSSDGENHWYACKKNASHMKDSAAHTSNNAHNDDCTVADECEVCGYDYNNAGSHDSDNAHNDDCTQPSTCNTCGTELFAAGSHTPGAAATCTTPQTCTVCNIVIADAAGHSWGDWFVTTPPLVGVAGEETAECFDCEETTTRPVDALTVVIAPQIRTHAATNILEDEATVTVDVLKGSYYLNWTLTLGSDEKAFGNATGDVNESVKLSGLSADTVYTYTITATDAVTNQSYSASGSFRTVAATPPVGATIEGTVKDSSRPVDVVVSLEHGNTVIRSASVGGSGSYVFRFNDVPDGIYNLVSDNGDYKVTVAVTVFSGAVIYPAGTIEINMAQGKTQSVIEIKTADTPSAAVDGLPQLFVETVEDDDKGVTSDDMKLVDERGGTVELKLIVEAVDSADIASDSAKLKGISTGQTIGLYLNLSVLKTCTDVSGEVRKEIYLTDLGSALLTVTFELPQELQGRSSLMIYRVHNETAEALPNGAGKKNSDGEYFSIEGNIVTLVVNKFSTYAIGYKTPVKSSTGSTGATLPTITLPTDLQGGSVSLSNDSKTITITADEGFEIADVTIDGVSVGAASSYTFSDSKDHTVGVTFRAISGETIHLCDAFADIKTHWAFDSICYVVESRLLIGTSPELFSPDLSTSRGMIVTVLWRLENEPDFSSDSSFADVMAGAYYHDAVAWAAENGIVLGYDEDRFGPDDLITREQMALMLYRYCQYKGIVLPVIRTNDLSDADSVSDWAAQAVRTMYQAGILNGKGSEIFDPQDFATRAETAQMMMNFVEGIQ